MTLRFLRSSAPALLALSLFAAAPLFAQTSATTGAVFGVVSGTDGAPLPGVSVALSGPALQGSRTVTTSATGEYVFPLLPPGDNYRVQSELSGFETQVRDAVVVSLNKQTRVNFTMSLTRVYENVTVTGGGVVVDPTETNTQVNLKEDFLKYASVGQVSRAYQSAIEVAPGVADQTGAGGNPSVFGANLGQNSYQVDGLNTTDPVTHTFSLNFGFDAIQEIAIQTGGFEAEYGRAVGGIINVITKSGGNRFSGTADARYTSDKLTEQGSRLRDVPAGATCGAINEPNNGANFLYVVATNLPQQTFKGRGMAFYMQDEWRPVPNVTVKLGARYDQTSYYNNEDTKVKVFDRVQPRFGFAWDIFNNASTVLRGQAGQFMEDLGLNVPSYLSTTGAVSSFFGFSRGRNQFVFLGAAGGPTGNEIDPGLKTTYTNEASVGIAQRVLPNTSIDVSYVYREGRNIIEDTCLDQAACPGVFFLTNAPNGNPDLLRSDYHGAILTIQSRLSNRASVLASYTYAKSRGSIEYTQNGGADFDVFPFHFVNRYGYLSDDARHRVKLDGYYRFPFDIVFGTHVYWDGGVPYNVTRTATEAQYGVEFLEPRGSRRLPHFSQWDAQLQKEFPIGPVRFSVIGSVFNILNSEIAVSRDGSVGTTDVATFDNPNFNVNNAYQRPRHYEVGLRLEF